MDWGTAGQWAGVLAAITIAIWGAMSKRNEKQIEGLGSDIRELKGDRNTLFKRLDTVERDVAVIRSEVEHLPTKDEMHVLEMKVVGIDGKMDAMLDKIGTLIGQNARAEERVIEAERRVTEAERKAR